MRIVGGTARGRRLAVPPKGTRPTSERAREALFNTLTTEMDLRDARVLDLFAGSGAVGLEALSRGGAEAVFVESDKQAATVVQANVDGLGFGSRARILRRTAEDFLAGAVAVVLDGPAPAVAGGTAREAWANGPGRFDLVFADPPYEVSDISVTALLSQLASGRWLAPHGLVVVERPARGGELVWPNEIKAIKQRRYGDGRLWYGRRV